MASKFDNQFKHDWQVLFLKIESMLIFCVYVFMLCAIIDTIRLHKIFTQKGASNKSMNLYLFYLLGIFVCFGRLLQQMSLFLALHWDNADASNYYNYGFYTATFCIVLIALSQINSITSTALKLRFVNKAVR